MIFVLSSIDWEPACIFEHVLRRMQDGEPLPLVEVEFRPYSGMNHTVRLRNGKLLVRLSDLLAGAPPAVVEALAVILLSKLYGHPVPARFRGRYLRYIRSLAIRQRIQQARALRGSKRAAGGPGKFHNLAMLFDRLNQRYFGGSLPRPVLCWSRHPSRTVLGHYDPAHHAIVITKLFDRPDVPALVVESVLYHEMLHIQHPPLENCGGTGRRVHSSKFLEQERRFQDYRTARKLLKAFHLSIAGNSG